MRFITKNYTKARSIFSLIRFYIRCRYIQKNESELFFFFPFFHVGGAERVHIDIIQTAANRNPWVFFTSLSENKGFLPEFKKYGTTYNIQRFAEGKYSNLTAKLLASLINRYNHPVVFGCNSYFFYNLIPYLKEHARCIDLIHAFSHKNEIAAEHWSLKVAPRLKTRIFISRKAIRDLEQQYEENQLSPSLMKRVRYIPNQVTVPDIAFPKTRLPLVNILYVGRGTPEKRVHLLGKIAHQCIEDQKLPVKFTLVGNIRHSIPEKFHSYLHFTGELQNQETLSEIYAYSDILLLTSSREGFPMAIMEAMAHGVVPVATDVGDIPAHITNAHTGFLVHNSSEECTIVNSFVKHIENLCNDKMLIEQLSLHAYNYAKENFSKKKFQEAYNEILNSDN